MSNNDGGGREIKVEAESAERDLEAEGREGGRGGGERRRKRFSIIGLMLFLKY